MRLLLLLSLLTTYVKSNKQSDIDICSLVDEPMFCTCDDYGHNNANKVSCSVVRKILHEDILWTGFQVQRNITDLTLSSLPDANLLDFVPSPVIRSLHSLTTFVMRGASLDTLWPYTFVNMSRLEYVSMERNKIGTLELYSVAYLPNLKELSLGENKIRKLPAETLYRLHVLEKLHLNGNNMTSIEDLAFVELPNLLELNLYSNHLHHLTAKTFVGLRSLRRLDLSRNKLTNLIDGVFSGTPVLVELDLWANHVAHVSPHAFDGLNHLKVLQLTGNRIAHLQDNVFKGSPSLEQVHLAHNRFTNFQRELLVPLNILEKPNFVLHLKGNPLNCSCDLFWITEMSENVGSHLFRKELRHLKCRNATSSSTEHKSQPENHHNDHRIVNLQAKDWSCPETTTVKSTIQTTAATTQLGIDKSQILESTPISDKNVFFSDNAINPNIGKPLHNPPANISRGISHPVIAEARSNESSMPSGLSLLIILSSFCLSMV